MPDVISGPSVSKRNIYPLPGYYLGVCWANLLHTPESDAKLSLNLSDLAVIVQVSDSIFSVRNFLAFQEQAKV